MIPCTPLRLFPLAPRATRVSSTRVVKYDRASRLFNRIPRSLSSTKPETKDTDDYCQIDTLFQDQQHQTTTAHPNTPIGVILEKLKKKQYFRIGGFTTDSSHSPKAFTIGSIYKSTRCIQSVKHTRRKYHPKIRL